MDILNSHDPQAMYPNAFGDALAFSSTVRLFVC